MADFWGPLWQIWLWYVLLFELWLLLPMNSTVHQSVLLVPSCFNLFRVLLRVVHSVDPFVACGPIYRPKS